MVYKRALLLNILDDIYHLETGDSKQIIKKMMFIGGMVIEHKAKIIQYSEGVYAYSLYCNFNCSGDYAVS